MQRFAIPAVLLALCTSAAFLPETSVPYDGPTGAFTVDTGHSAVMFRIKHMDVAYNYGRFNEFSGALTLDAKPANCKVEITLRTGSVDTNDEKRDGHIMSGDFLGAEDFPEATFTSTKVAVKDKTYTVTGDLALHGKTKEVTFDMEMTGFAAETRMGPKLGIETYPNEALSDKITLILAIEANGVE